ncbi:L-serine ammonia-lyase, iron-sulfur-dependent, subunit alpha [Lancefieldella parvula]|uniref:L-serine ammonia-lyase, iron-sulfur-dependent, subunit alpha n=1 Tax=Lancefieldella parvula TaxID=1382 RepID=UPI00288A4393|nr:L-serine ammonia-lyase, iron-sulfur-dependent, subunit alpha [Lancefieldella parvula]
MISMSAFEVLGPIMVGPSSSHTAGALRIALVARSLAPKQLERVEFWLYNSFSHTHLGHGTDCALIAGILGLAPDDTRVREALTLAEEAHLNYSVIEKGDDETLHPNTVEIHLYGADNTHVSVMGESVGGGRIRISGVNGVRIRMSGEMPTIFVSHRDKPGVLAALTTILATQNINVATMRTFRSERGGFAHTVFEIDEPIEQKVLDLFQLAPHVSYAAQVSIPGAAPQVTNDVLSGAFDNGADLLARRSKTGASIGQIMCQREKGLRPDADIDAEMAHVLEIMRDEVHDTIKVPRQSIGGLLNGQAKTVANTPPAISNALMGTTQTRAVAYAMAVLERSATMGVIVAAPTAGASGVVPGSLISVAEEIGATDEQVISALWNASAIGAILTTNASVSGAEGGCQAEVGSAAAMSASALTELLGGTPQQCLDAASIAISNLLGLICDPVRGLVEYPCQDRNAIGVAAAISSSQLALAGVGNPIPFDEVAHAMAEVGAALPVSLRETAKGGLAATPSAPTACASCTGCVPLNQTLLDAERILSTNNKDVPCA